MKLASYRHEGRDRYGVLVGDELVTLGPDAGFPAPSLSSFIAGGGLSMVTGNPPVTAAGTAPLDAVTFLPVIPDAGFIVCVGMNYAKHVQEMGKEVPSYPALFSRNPRVQVGHGQPLIRPRVSEKLDYEGELAIIIGKPGAHIPEGRAMEHVAGFANYNDASVRDYQRHTAQFLPGKNFRGTGGFGPWLVTPDEVPDLLQTGTVTTRLNGTVVQHSPLSDMIFGIPALIAYVSTFIDLMPGDVLVTGTPSGVGAARQPPLFLKGGDVVEVEISGLGALRNPVVDESGD